MNTDILELRSGERGRWSRPDTPLTACVIWGNDYATGVANLGHQRVWAICDDAPGWSADRLYALTRPEDKPTSWDWGRPLGGFDLVLASVCFENDYPALLDLLAEAGLLCDHTERRGPLLIAGGIAPSLNPRPLAPFFDAVYEGDAEVILPLVLERIAQQPPRNREDAWSLFAELNLYVGALGNHGEYRLWTSTDDVYAASETIHPAGHFGETALVELGRGCPWRCRFCAASWAAGGFRPSEPAALRGQISEKMEHFYVERVGLVGTAVAEGDDFCELLVWLKEQGLRATASSLRADLLTEETAGLLVELGQRTLTLSAETGSEELRNSLGKGLSDENLLAAAKAVERAGARYLKLYFMYGLPGETDADLKAVGYLVSEIKKRLRRTRLTVSASPFVPKPHTPLADVPLLNEGELRRMRELLARELRRAGIGSFSGESPRQALWQAALARGNEDILRRYRSGESRGRLIREAVNRR
ncbi:B12-binding domain-containing radical SAM protein [bacterium]|nr:B12-binding domain-containing radical SAM protein [bacterium]